MVSVQLKLPNQLQIFSQLHLIDCWAFNMFGANQAVAIDISKAFNKVSHAGLLQELKFDEIFGRVFSLVFSFFFLFSNR